MSSRALFLQSRRHKYSPMNHHRPPRAARRDPQNCVLWRNRQASAPSPKEQAAQRSLAAASRSSVLLCESAGGPVRLRTKSTAPAVHGSDHTMRIAYLFALAGLSDARWRRPYLRQPSLPLSRQRRSVPPPERLTLAPNAAPRVIAPSPWDTRRPTTRALRRKAGSPLRAAKCATVRARRTPTAKKRPGATTPKPQRRTS